MEIPKINLRVSQIIDYKSGGSRKNFSENIGIAQQTINRLFNLDTRTNKYPVVTTDVLVAITEMYVDIDTRWLLTGLGSMLIPDAPVPEKSQQQPVDTKDAVIDKLIKEVKELSAENAVLKLEIEKLKKDIKHKSNPYPHTSVVTEP